MREGASSILGLVAFALAGCTSGGTTGTTGAGGTTGTSPPDAGEDGPSDAGTDAPADAGASDCGGLAWKTPACGSCTDEHCCDLEKLCAAIPSCAPLDACWNACGGDGGCQNGCGTQYLQAISNYNAILNCQNNSCAAVCN
jgi:hypothetical protein